MNNTHWLGVSGAAAIFVIVAVIAFLAYQPVNSAGAFPTGPTLKDTGGVCVPNGETGCSNPGAPPCCHPASCVNRIAQLYIPYGVCKIPFSTA